MEQNLSIFFLASACILLLVVLAKAIILKKANTLLSQQLTETSNSLEQTQKSLATLREKQQKLTEFQNSLSDAELSTKIHKSRAIHAGGDRPRTTPERYSYIHSLAPWGPRRKIVPLSPIATLLVSVSGMMIWPLPSSRTGRPLPVVKTPSALRVKSPRRV